MEAPGRRGVAVHKLELTTCRQGSNPAKAGISPAYPLSETGEQEDPGGRGRSSSHQTEEGPPSSAPAEDGKNKSPRECKDPGLGHRMEGIGWETSTRKGKPRTGGGPAPCPASLPGPPGKTPHRRGGPQEVLELQHGKPQPRKTGAEPGTVSRETPASPAPRDGGETTEPDPVCAHRNGAAPPPGAASGVPRDHES